MADIFDFQIAIQARDDASAVLDDVIGKFQSFEEEMDKARKSGEKAKEDIDPLGDKTPSKLQLLTNAVNDVSDAMGTLAGIPERIASSFDQTFLDMEDGFQRISAQSSMSAQDASAATDRYSQSALELSAATGVSVQAITELGVALGQSAIFLDDADVMANARAITHLGTTYGITGEQVASLISNTRFLGLSIAETLDTAANASAAFKTPGLIENLPEILTKVNDMYAEFGDRVVGSTKPITDSFIKQAATVSKAYNITMAEAISKVSEATRSFVNELDQLDDVSLGLADDFGGGTNALFELGLGMEETKRLLKLGQTDALGFAEAIRNAAATKDMFTQRRLLKNIGKEFGGQTKELLLRESTYQSMITTRAEAQKRQNAGMVSFEEMTKSFRDSGKQAIEIFKNVVTLGKTIIGSVFGKSAKTIFGDSAKGLEGINTWLISINKTMNDPNSFFSKSVRPILDGIGKGVLLLTGAFGSLAGAFGLVGVTSLAGKSLKFVNSFLDPKKMGKIGKGIQGVGKMFGSIGKIFKFLGKGAKLLGKTILFPLAIIEGVGVALNAMGKIFRDPEATGVEKFGAIIGGVLEGFDAFLLGIPGKIISWILPGFDEGIAVGVNGLFQSISEYFTGGGFSATMSNMTAQIGEFFSSLPETISSFFADMGPMISDLGKNIGAGLAGLITFFIHDLPSYFQQGISAGIKWIMSFFTGEGGEQVKSGVGNMLLNAFASVQEVIKGAFSGLGTFFQGLWDGILESFGMNTKSLKQTLMVGVGAAWNGVMDIFGAGMLFVKGLFGGFEKVVVNVWTGLKAGVLGFTFMLRSAFQSAIGFIGGMWSGLLGTIATGLSYVNKDFADKVQGAADAITKATTGNQAALDKERKDKMAALLAERDTALSLIDLKQKKREEAFEQEKDERKESLAREVGALNRETAHFKKTQERRLKIERARRAANERDKKKDKGGTPQKPEDVLKNSKEWIAAVEKAQAAIDAAREKAIKGGMTPAEIDKAENKAVFSEAAKLDKVRDDILGRAGKKSKGAPDIAKIASPSTKAEMASSVKKEMVDTTAKMPTATPSQAKDTNDKFDELIELLKNVVTDQKIVIDLAPGLIKKWQRDSDGSKRRRQGG